ncbi:sensor domain-containing diguanylate cyclase [Alcaligenes faecalis]|uniref:sensor domain-containing diguanylate cyclase n=2 Tax=Alcaligenes faecalis TaxID=511 RepID=UPI002932E29B|nr:sensor domain-containing diguanylate cyclase [Alcaligenes faecalis]MDV2114837.1 sensor domain-containing diguanylate cyclase [Alcaligenes faecalis]
MRSLILWLCLSFVLLVLFSSLHAAYRVQQGLLLEQSVRVNQAYAERLAHASDDFLRSSAAVLKSAALDITAGQLDAAVIREEFRQVMEVTKAFDALVLVDVSGSVLAASPNSALLDVTLPLWPERFQGKAWSEPMVTGAFQAGEGRWMTMVATPVFAPNGAYAGFMGGGMYLQSRSALQESLDKLSYEEGTYFRIVDGSQAIIYHPEQSQIGSRALDVVAVIEQSLINSRQASPEPDVVKRDQELVSVAAIPTAGWVVIAQRPTERVLANTGELLLRTFLLSLPVFAVSLLAIWYFSGLIANPLRQLAIAAANLDNHADFRRIRFVRGWYVEAALIRQGLMHSFSAIGSRIRKLYQQGATDPLTGTMNRRGLDAALEEMTEAEQSVAVVMIDIDHFKTVNDRFGHAAGDEVLKAIAELIMAQVRREDVVARLGGEEFVLVLPEVGLDAAGEFAERLRLAVANTAFEAVESVTVSLGVACYPAHGNDLYETLALADAALYRAKADGRNRVHLAE